MSSSYTKDLETNWAIAGAIAATGAWWAPALVSGDMLVGAVAGGVGMAGGRVLNLLLMQKSVQNQVDQIAMAGIVGAGTGAAVMMLLAASPSLANSLGVYTDLVAMGGGIAAANYYFDRSSFKNALSGM
jgi:hypothetical protein